MWLLRATCPSGLLMLHLVPTRLQNWGSREKRPTFRALQREGPVLLSLLPGMLPMLSDTPTSRQPPPLQGTFLQTPHTASAHMGSSWDSQVPFHGN